MKTARYYISFDNLEVDMSTAIEISKTEYNRQFKFLRSQVEANATNPEATVEELEEKVYDLGNAVKTMTFFCCGCAATLLQKVECKPGYHFKTK